ncbi:hypothetical protein PYCC9005_002256 [Savitreella phatthalungensis]
MQVAPPSPASEHMPIDSEPVSDGSVGRSMNDVDETTDDDDDEMESEIDDNVERGPGLALDPTARRPKMAAVVERRRSSAAAGTAKPVGAAGLAATDADAAGNQGNTEAAAAVTANALAQRDVNAARNREMARLLHRDFDPHKWIHIEDLIK